MMVTQGATRNTVWPRVVFYGGLLLLMVTVVSGALARWLPPFAANHIGWDSEAYVFAIAMAAWVEFGCWRLAGRARLATGLLIGLAFLILYFIALIHSLPNSFTTLSEAFFALAILVPYAAIERPLGVWPLAASALLVAAIIIGVGNWPKSAWLMLAEGLSLIVLAPWAFDLLDRSILDLRQPARAAKRAVLYVILILTPVAVVLMGTSVRYSGSFVSWVLQYIGRSQESFLGLLLVMAYLAIVRPKRSRSKRKEYEQSKSPLSEKC